MLVRNAFSCLRGSEEVIDPSFPRSRMLHSYLELEGTNTSKMCLSPVDLARDVYNTISNWMIFL